MGFNTCLADDLLDTANIIPPEETPLEMGFEMDPVQVDPDQSCKFIVFQNISHC